MKIQAAYVSSSDSTGSRWDSSISASLLSLSSIILRLRLDLSIFPCKTCKIDHSGRTAHSRREKNLPLASSSCKLHGQRGEQISCSLVQDLLLTCVIMITLVTHCHWIFPDAEMKDMRCEPLLLCCFSRQSVLARGWISACVELLQPPTEIAVNTDSNDSIVLLPFRPPLGYGLAE